MKTSNKILILGLVSILLYTSIGLALAFFDKAVPDTLTQCFYAFWGGEITVLGGIKISKVAKGTDLSNSTECKTEDESLEEDSLNEDEG